MMAKSKIDVDTVLETLRTVVAESPKGADTKYSDIDPKYGTIGGCRYKTSAGTPLCIVGQVLAKLGRTLPSKNVGWNQRANREFTDEANAVLRAAQKVQDYNDTWGEALKAAERTAE